MSIQKNLDILIGKTCWGFLAGIPNGSFIHLHLGERVKRNKPINNDKLPYELDKFNGEYHIGIFCAWRLQKKGIPITGSCEPNELDGPLVNGLKNILGKKVSSVELTDECGDVSIFFDDICLKVFCNYTGNEDEQYCVQDETNWFLRSEGKTLIEVKQGCKVHTTF